MIVHIGNVQVDQNGWASGQYTVPDPTYAIEAQIGSSAWDRTTGTWSWSVDYMRTDGTWGVMVGQGHLADPINGIDGNIGDRDRLGGFPMIHVEAGDLDPDTGESRRVNLGGMVVRLRLWASTRINLNQCDITLDQNP